MNIDHFGNARIKLTLWYSLILALIIVAFSLAQYASQTGNFARIVVERQYGSHVPKKVTPAELRDLREQVRELRRSFVTSLILTDVIVVLLGGILSYFLAGRTLAPIEESLKRQKLFLADASHELRTPLSGIQVSCEVALRSNRLKQKDYKNVIEQIYPQIKRLSKMANDLLFLSQVDFNLRTKHLTRCDLSKIVAQGVGVVELRAEDRKLKISRDIAESVFVKGDFSRLEQLVLILLDNAIKFSREEGMINVSLSSGVRPKLVVEDNGVGISSKDRAHIFERFYQADSSRSVEGSGLGLSIASAIATEHNADIKVESELGKGAKFSVIFNA